VRKASIPPGKRILIVEDQFIEANNLQMILEKAGYHVCGIARSVTIGLDLVRREQPDLVLLDIFLQGNLTGIDMAHRLNELGIGFVYLSANSNKDTLEAAKITKPYGFLVKPFREKDILVTLDIAWYLHEEGRMAREQETQRRRMAQTPASVPALAGIIGSSAALKKVLQSVLLVAPAELSVLILGESGTGKERIAQGIHELSPRKNKPLIKVNCAALPATLIESVLFGHEKGAFTGAYEKHIGKFEQADGGTIFLDEIGELPLEVQVKLLRVLQEKEIERIGGRNTIGLNVRIIAATNRNLEQEVAEGRFRMDLYYRLNVFPIELPGLRNRKEDIPLLAVHFIEKCAASLGRRVHGIEADALEQLMQYDWPGNIRELENVIERSVLMARGTSLEEMIMPAVPASAVVRQAAASKPLKTIEENERDHIIAALQQTGGKISGPGGAAEMLGINVSTLNSRMRKLGIRKEVIALRDPGQTS
jgi:DNA-binding NtrC family response regulator